MLKLLTTVGTRTVRTGRGAGTGGALAALLLASLGASAARAEPGLVTWTTYVYEGPGKHYQVNDELFQMTPVEVLGCSGEWCHISAGGHDGYVFSEVVVTRGQNPASPPAGKLGQPAASIIPNPSGPCFEANQKGGNGGHEMTRFCEKQSP